MAHEAMRAARDPAAHVDEWTSRIDDLAGALARGEGDLPAGARTDAALARLNEFLRARPMAATSPAELAQAIGMSDRTLRRVVLAQFGMSVGSYLRVRRLNAVHRELRDPARTPPSVTEVATRYGFFDLGRFAAQYHRLFGELPSRTLTQRLASGR
jgi:AraC-like DNA-binding protein